MKTEAGGAQTRTMTPSPPFISFIQAVNEPFSRLPRAQVCLATHSPPCFAGGFVVVGHVLCGHAAD